MDPVVSHVAAVAGRAAPGTLILDPFCGTGKHPTINLIYYYYCRHYFLTLFFTLFSPYYLPILTYYLFDSSLNFNPSSHPLFTLSPPSSHPPLTLYSHPIPTLLSSSSHPLFSPSSHTPFPFYSLSIHPTL